VNVNTLSESLSFYQYFLKSFLLIMLLPSRNEYNSSALFEFD
jgi:hypothetical protein